MEFFDSIIRILQLVLDVSFFHHYYHQNDISGCPSMDTVQTFLHSHFFMLADSIQESCCKLFEKVWTTEMDFRENYVPNMCTYLMTMAVRPGRSFSSYMNRLYLYLFGLT